MGSAQIGGLVEFFQRGDDFEPLLVWDRLPIFLTTDGPTYAVAQIQGGVYKPEALMVIHVRARHGLTPPVGSSDYGLSESGRAPPVPEIRQRRLDFWAHFTSL